MKKIYLFIFTVIAFFILMQNTQAQVVDVCAGTDSITLRVGNYQYGTIEWESSYDSVHWTKIEGANDTIYKFLPTETKYYRAVGKFSECPPEYSEMSLVQMAPKADAGSDRIVPSNSVFMMANLKAGENGNWSILNGSGASFTDANNPYSEFQGTDSIYTIMWTVNNACGTSSDTINIQFRNNTYINPLVVVDTTDNLLSDSTQLANGEYIINFNTPVPQITDSTVLIGLINDGFLRKVISFNQSGNTFTMQTEQASLEDITIDGAYDVAQVFNIDTTTGTKSTNYKRLNHMPTRAELSSNMYKKGNYYYIVKNEPAYTYPGVKLKNPNTKNGGKQISLQFDRAILNTGNINLELNGSYSFKPNIKSDLDYHLLHLNTFKLGMYNGKIVRNYELTLTTSASTSILNHEFTLFNENKDIVVVAGGVPIWIRTEFKIDGQVSADVSSNMNITHEYNKTSVYTAAMEYENSQWNYIFNKNDDVQTNNDFTVTGDLTQSFDIGPNITFKLFGIVGPYIDARITEDLDLCTYNNNWQANIDIGGEISVGAKAEVITDFFSVILFDKRKTWSQGFYHLQFPYSLEYISGNNQNYTSGTSLTQPAKVRVISNKGFAIPGAFVNFSPQNGGSVENNMVTADANGYAQTTWTPGASNSSTLQAYILDCDGNNINNSPIVFTAYEESDNCSQSSLYVSISVSGNNISPVAQMGTPPYSYSTDDINYSSTVPTITTTAGNNYTFYVKDANNCTATASYTAPSDICLNSDLSLNLSVNGNTIEANAVGGTAPYKYVLDVATGSFSSSNIFNNISTGSHTIYTQDANGCTTSANTYIYSSGGTVTDYDGNIYQTVQIGNQIWMAENLKVTHYPNGTAIPLVTDNTAWSNLGDNNTDDAYCYYNNSSTNADTYGALYTWAAAMGDNAVSSTANPSGVQGVCPDGWHLPSDAEWKQLEMYLGMSQAEADYTGWRGTDEGSKLKATSGWNSDGNGTNTSGFTALPGGYRDNDYGYFDFLGGNGNFWSATESNVAIYAWIRILVYYSSNVRRLGNNKSYGFSVRCLRD